MGVGAEEGGGRGVARDNLQLSLRVSRRAARPQCLHCDNTGKEKDSISQIVTFFFFWFTLGPSRWRRGNFGISTRPTGTGFHDVTEGQVLPPPPPPPPPPPRFRAVTA